MENVDLSITVDDNKMAAYLTLEPQTNKPSITVEEVEARIKEEGVRFGIDGEKIKNAVVNFTLIKKPMKNVCFAKGISPGLGNSDSVYFDYLDSNTIEEGVYDTEQAFFDEKDFDLPENVEEGERILTITRKDDPFAGRNVYDEPLPPRKGEAINIKPLNGILVGSEGLIYQSKIKGQVVFTHEGVSVLPVKEIRSNIDKKVGDIDYEGNVMVRGSIMDNAKVSAKGNIIVYGTVCEAVVKANGNVKINDNILGKKRATIIAGGDVVAKNATNAYIDAKRSINIGEQIKGCEIIAGKAVYIRKNLASNNRIYAHRYLWARYIGSDISKNIDVTLGLNGDVARAVLERRRKLNQAKAKLIQTNDVLKQYIQSYGALNKVPDKFKDDVKNRVETLNKLKEMIQTLEGQRQQLVQSCSTNGRSAELEAFAVYPGVTLSFYDQSLTVSEQETEQNFYYADGRIVTRSIEEARAEREDE